MKGLTSDNTFRECLIKDDLEGVKKSLLKGGTYPVTDSEVKNACYYGSIKVLKYLVKHLQVRICDTSIYQALSKAQFETLLYVLNIPDYVQRANIRMDMICGLCKASSDQDFGVNLYHKNETIQRFKTYQEEFHKLGYKIYADPEDGFPQTILFQFTLLLAKRNNYNFTWDDYFNLQHKRIFIDRSAKNEIDQLIIDHGIRGMISKFTQGNLTSKNVVEVWMIPHFQLTKSGNFSENCFRFLDFCFNRVLFDYICDMDDPDKRNYNLMKYLKEMISYLGDDKGKVDMDLDNFALIISAITTNQDRILEIALACVSRAAYTLLKYFSDICYFRLDLIKSILYY